MRLYYAEDEHDAKPLGFIDLTRVKAIAANQNTKYGIDIITPSRTYYLQANDEAERKYCLSSPFVRACALKKLISLAGIGSTV
jgi:hypothetical protein